jgi:hypothetical protein
VYSGAGFPASKHTLQKGVPALWAASLASDDEGLVWVWYIGIVRLLSLPYITHVEKAIQFFAKSGRLNFKILKNDFFSRLILDFLYPPRLYPPRLYPLRVSM